MFTIPSSPLQPVPAVTCGDGFFMSDAETVPVPAADADHHRAKATASGQDDVKKEVAEATPYCFALD